MVIYLSSNKRKNLILLALIFCCCLITVGYFNIISRTVVDGRIKFEAANWSIKFTDIKTIDTIGKAINYENPKLSSYLVSFYAKFEEPGDSLTYEVEVSNLGNIDAELQSINLYSDILDFIDFEYSNIEVGNILKAGEKKKFEVKVSCSRVATSSIKDNNKLQLVLNWVQAS